MERTVADDQLFDNEPEPKPTVKPEPKSEGGPSLEETAEQLRETVVSLQNQIAAMQQQQVIQQAQAEAAQQAAVDPSEKSRPGCCIANDAEAGSAPEATGGADPRPTC
jgi:hypothetical protein